jgi:hypothetical protein
MRNALGKPVRSRTSSALTVCCLDELTEIKSVLKTPMTHDVHDIRIRRQHAIFRSMG